MYIFFMRQAEVVIAVLQDFRSPVPIYQEHSELFATPQGCLSIPGAI
jgi:hypothetical protein